LNRLWTRPYILTSICVDEWKITTKDVKIVIYTVLGNYKQQLFKKHNFRN